MFQYRLQESQLRVLVKYHTESFPQFNYAVPGSNKRFYYNPEWLNKLIYINTLSMVQSQSLRTEFKIFNGKLT